MKPIQTPGAFSWSELQTSDLEKAAAFYSKIFGWKVDFMDMPMGKYGVGSIGKFPVAGLMNRVSEDIPVSWGFYVTVTDVDSCIEKAESLGATKIVDSFDVEGVGRMGVFQDPQGAVLSVLAYFEPEHELHQAEHEASFATHGAFSWFELRVPDASKAVPFYTKLFGWDVKEMDMEMGPYHVFDVGGASMGGLMSVPSEEMPPHWAAYVTVSSAADFVEAVNQNGGKVLHGPHPVPSVGQMVLFSDPQGGMLSAFEYDMPEQG